VYKDLNAREDQCETIVKVKLFKLKDVVFMLFIDKQKVVSPKTSNARSKKQASFETPEPTTEAPSPANESVISTGAEEVVAPKPKDTTEPDDGEVFESESSESDDDDEVTGLTEEEEKERQREKREKVNMVYTCCRLCQRHPHLSLQGMLSMLDAVFGLYFCIKLI